MMYTDKKRKNPLILVVDDDPSLSMVMVAALEKFGFDVVEASSGSQGIELFRSEKPDIVLMDVMRPRGIISSIQSRLRSLLNCLPREFFNLYSSQWDTCFLPIPQCPA